MSATNLPRNNFFDGQNVDETDLDVEQTAWHDTVANDVNFISGSGVEQEFSAQRVLFDTASLPASTMTLISSGNFDGTPIYQNDSFGLTIFSQPSDAANGCVLEVKLSGSDLVGALSLKVYLFGETLGGTFIYEVLTFTINESQTTRQYFTKLYAIVTQDFLGNQNALINGTPCRSAGGRLEIFEALPMSVVRDTIMAQQAYVPNLDFVDFKPAVTSQTLEDLLEEIAAVDNKDYKSLGIQTKAATQRTLIPNDTNGTIIGQKFLATTDNIQKVSILLGIKENTLAIPGHEYDWSGDIVVGIRALQQTTVCPTDTIPGTAIQFDPEPSSLAEVSFGQADLRRLGIVLNGEPQVVDFVFTQSLLANPSIASEITAGKYYIVTIRRTGNTSNGTIIIPESTNNTNESTYMSVFSQNMWTDVTSSTMWFKIYTSALRITNGTAVDEGMQIVLPKTQLNSATGITTSYIDGWNSFINTSASTSNYVIVQAANDFSLQIPNPTTGTKTFSRITDIPDISVVPIGTLSTLIGAGNTTIVLGEAKDKNPVNNPIIGGTSILAGLVTTNTFTIIQPSTDLLYNNLIGSILTPDTSHPEYTYRIIASQYITDAYGDVNKDGNIDLSDVAAAQMLDGYSLSLMQGVIPPATQLNAIIHGTVTIDELIRADVLGDGVVDIYDAQAIQQHISLGTAFPVGSNFHRIVLTVESILNPLSLVPNMIADNPLFNTVPFIPLSYEIEFVPLWRSENIVIQDMRRYVAKTFSEISVAEVTAVPPVGGTNTAFLPGNVLLGGELLNKNGTQYAIDLEVGIVVMDLPAGSTQGEIDLFNNFVKNKMQFNDGTYVAAGAIERNQVRVATSIQSFTKDFPPADGYDFMDNDGYAAIDETVSVLYTQTSGVVRIRANNIRNVPTRPELRTKIIFTVFLKKAGFKNAEQDITDTQVFDLLTPF